jgi:protein-disulfide isomerase
MPSNSKIKVTAIVIAFSLAVVYGVKFFSGIMPQNTLSPAQMRTKGDKGATIQITEFIDFECPACARGAEYLSRVMAEHPAGIRLELKYFPLPSHRHGFLAARYAECAARQGKFWLFHDALIARQPNWSRLTDATPAFALIAREIALDPGRLDACLNDKSVDALIQQSHLEGERQGVKSTPTYYVNGKMVVGVPSLELELGRLLAEIKK